MPGARARGQLIERHRELRDLQDALLDEAGVATVAGTSFGAQGEGYLRFSYASSIDNIQEAVARIQRFLERRND